MSKILLYEKTLVKSQDLGLYSGDIAIIPDSLNSHPRLNWAGSIIDIDQFRTALAFLKWTHDEHHVEGQIRLFYNEFTREWKAVALPQYIWSAGHTREVEENDPVKSEIIEELLNSGFGQAGTGHHHSTMSAFQSGGDKEDELGQNGFHFTVGHMGSDIADFHCRATFRKINYDPNQGMLNPSQWLPGLHNRMIQDKEIKELWLSLKNLPPFPEIWKTYLRAKPELVVQTWNYQGFGRGCHSQWKPDSMNTEPKMEMFRDGFFCIFFKPSNPTVHYRTFITPKKYISVYPAAATGQQTAAEISRPITAPAPTQAEINQKRLEELEQKQAAEKTAYSSIVAHAADMTPAEFEAFCLTLQRDRNQLILDNSRTHDTSTARGRVLDRLEECLAQFRDSAVPARGTQEDLQNVFDAIQDASHRIVGEIERVLITHSSYLAQYLEEEQIRELLLNWGSVLFDQLLCPSSKEEWKEMCDESNRPVASALDFYQTMCNGLKIAMALETIDPLYDEDGTMSVVGCL